MLCKCYVDINFNLLEYSSLFLIRSTMQIQNILCIIYNCFFLFIWRSLKTSFICLIIKTNATIITSHLLCWPVFEPQIIGEDEVPPVTVKKSVTQLPSESG